MWDFDQRGNLGWWGPTVHSKSGYGELMEWKDFFNHEKQILNLGDQSFSIGGDTQVVVVNRTNTKIVPFEVPSTSETDVASSGTSQSSNALWEGVA